MTRRLLTISSFCYAPSLATFCPSACSPVENVFLDAAFSRNMSQDASVKYGLHGHSLQLQKINLFFNLSSV